MGISKIANINKPDDEVEILNKWIEDKANNPVCRHGGQRFDSSEQTEGIGNDQVKSSTYVIKNLKIVPNNLTKWTSDQTNNYEDLNELYDELLNVWGRYVGHVTGNIGSVYEFIKIPSQTRKICIHTKSLNKKSP